MVRPYSLLFLGHQTFKGTLSLEDSIDCWQLVTIALHSRLKSLDHVHYSFRDNRPNDPGSYSRLPAADAVLFWGMPQTWMRYDHRRLKRATGCRAIITLCERAITANSDWQFAFCGDGARTTRVDAPVWKGLYNHYAKRPKTVLLDHWDQDTPWDWTYQIEAWLEDLGDEFDISRYVQNESPTGALEREKSPPSIKKVRRVPFTQWLAATDRLETFVVTHRETYGYAILDMFARGTRVACPAPLLPSHFKDRFHFDTFRTKDDLIKLLRTRPNELDLSRNRAGLSDWDDLVELIDQRFQDLLSRRYRKSLSRPVGRLLGR